MHLSGWFTALKHFVLSKYGIYFITKFFILNFKSNVTLIRFGISLHSNAIQNHIQNISYHTKYFESSNTNSTTN